MKNILFYQLLNIQDFFFATCPRPRARTMSYPSYIFIVVFLLNIYRILPICYIAVQCFTLLLISIAIDKSFNKPYVLFFRGPTLLVRGRVFFLLNLLVKSDFWANMFENYLLREKNRLGIFLFNLSYIM